MPDENHWTITSQIAVVAAKVGADTPLFGQDETVRAEGGTDGEKREMAAITGAPPRIAPLEVPETFAN
jgi:4-diphosphocytidyl-2C-methyl-D-erythritol kinase